MTQVQDNAALTATQRTAWVDAQVHATARGAAEALVCGAHPVEVATWLYVATQRIARVTGPVDGDVWRRYGEAWADHQARNYARINHRAREQR